MGKLDKYIEKNYKKLYWIMTSAALALCFAIAFSGDFWYDEAFTLGIIKQPFGEICRITAMDVHPPLYYILLKIFSAPFGNKLFAAHIFSLLPYYVILLVGGKTLKELFGKRTSITFIAVFIFFPFLLIYWFEARMYSLAGMFVFLNALAAYRCYERGGAADWIFFVLWGSAAAYTHYFAMVSAGVTYALLLAAIIASKRRLLPKWLIAAAATVIVYIPWLGCFIAQLVFKANHAYWIAPITFDTFRGYIRDLFGVGSVEAVAIIMLIFYIIAVAYAVRRKNKKKNIMLLLCCLVPLLTLLIGVGVSLAVRPVFVIRYIVPSMPLFIAALAIALGEADRSAVYMPPMVLLAVCFVLNYIGTTYVKYFMAESVTIEKVLSEAGEYECIYFDMNKSADPYGESQFHSLFSYYEADKQIYGNIGRLENAVPFPNTNPAEEFAGEDYDSVLYVTAEHEPIDKKLKKQYSECKFINTVSTKGHSANIYILSR